MISQMDQIYANASITIIAASDGDTEMGLCGVSKPRQLQRHVNIQDVALLELPLGHQALKSSKWASRGWTYQEGYLSTKRLIFTNNQILFLCNGSYGSECLQQLLDTPCCTNSTMRFSSLIPYFTTTSRRFLVKDLLRHVQEYSERDLTRPSDSLNAFLGVLSYYAKNSADLTSPVVQLPWGLFANEYSNTNHFSLHFFWSHKRNATRRPDFPSWSWTGWGGPLQFLGPWISLKPRHGVEEGPYSYLDWEVSVRKADGLVVKMYDLVLEEFEARKIKYRLYQPGPKQLQISCLAIPVGFQQFNLTEDQKRRKTEITIHDIEEHVSVGRDLPNGVHAIFQAWKGIYVGSNQTHLRLDRQVEQKGEILGLIFVDLEQKREITPYVLLLVQPVGEDLYERVGLLKMNEFDLGARVLGNFPFKLTRQVVYMDAAGSILDTFTVSDRQRRHPFADTAESRTICLA